MTKQSKPIFLALAVGLLFDSSLLFSANITRSENVRDAIVLVVSRSVKGMMGGCGFVIGDGSLIVTAQHVVYEKSEHGQHQAAALVDITSAYLGDVTDAEIIASDAALDLAILKTSWKSHPALSMANTSQLLSCDTMNVMGIPDIIWGISKESTTSMPENLVVQNESLFVDYVAMRQKSPRFISLSNPVILKHG
jgi:S1-C subfamily serine protease